jgi:hypothetical protein
MAGIRDGSSNVLMFSEKRMDDSKDPGAQPGDANGFAYGHNIDSVRSAYFPPSRDYIPTQSFSPVADAHVFGSSHPGIVVAVMCDSSTRTLSFSIDQVLFAAVCMRRDGNAVSLDQ